MHIHIPSDESENTKEGLIKFLEQNKGRKMFTLTSNYHPTFASGIGLLQFRCWNGIFAFAAPDHVDSCGENLLFTVAGKKEELLKFAEEIIPDYFNKWETKGILLWTP